MKRTYTLVAFLCCTLGLQAQIVFDSSYMPVPGDSIVYHTDTLATPLSPGASGEAQSWNFSDLGDHVVTTTYYYDPADTPNGADFPNANLALGFGGGEFFIYNNVSDTQSETLGFAVDFTGTGELSALAFPNPQTNYEFPSDYGSSFSDEYSVELTFDGTAFEVDSIRYERQGTYNVNVDGWGQITTPMGTFGCLRRHISDNYTETISVFTFGAWFPFNEETGVEESYEWLAQEAKGPVLTMNIDNATGQATTVDYAEATPIPIPEAAFDFTINDLEIGFNDLSTGTITAWFWDFGDGNTSTEQNPTHIFASSGTYNVCLTVSNGSGSDTYCQNVPAFAASTHELANAVDILLSPNPAKETVYLEIKENGTFDVQITDLLGRTLKQVTGLPQGRHALPLTGLPTGTYLFRIQDANSGKISVRKMSVR